MPSNDTPVVASSQPRRITRIGLLYLVSSHAAEFAVVTRARWIVWMQEPKKGSSQDFKALATLPCENVGAEGIKL